jgi:hypothetical protein
LILETPSPPVFVLNAATSSRAGFVHEFGPQLFVAGDRTPTTGEVDVHEF